MDDRQLADVLDAQSGDLPMLGLHGDWRAKLPEAAFSLAPLIELAQEIAFLLTPIRPRPEFRAELMRGLLAEARRQEAQRMLMPELAAHANGNLGTELIGRVNGWAEQQGLDEDDRRLMWRAAMVGSALSVAGILAFLLHQRTRPAAAA